jgi:hypothetical protein
MNIDTGGDADKETIAGFLSKFSAGSCPNPSAMKVRRADTKQNATSGGVPQIYKSFDLKTGFVCLKSDQPSGAACFDYEVQLCCPSKPTR